MDAEGNEPATKADLKALESSLHGDLAAKADIARLDAKIGGLNVKTDKIWKEAVNTWTRMDRMEERIIARMDAGFDRVTQSIDSFAAKVETYARETLILPKTLAAHGDELRDHEKRIEALEAGTAGHPPR